MRRARSFVVALLTVAVAAIVWSTWPRSAADPAPLPVASAWDDVDASAAPPATAGSQLQAASAKTEGQQRVAVASSAERPRGALRVTALWPGDRPATGVTIYLRRRAEQYMPHDAFARGSTDEQGVVVFRGVEPGPARLDSDRGDRKDVDVVAGEQTVEFALKDGVGVRGTVSAPDGARVANAEVWLQTPDTTWTGGRVVATTDAAGEYAIEHIDPKHSLGATAAGFAPSPLVDLDVLDTSKPPVVVDLKLRPAGGNLAGRVTNAAGEPVAQAVVAVGRNPDRLDTVGERIIEHWTVRTAETAADGSFAVAGIAAGKTAVAIRADGYGLWRDEVTIAADETTTIAPRLQAAAVVHGQVTNREGAPVVGAAVRAYDRAPGTHFLAGGQVDFDETFGYRGTVAGEDGRYRIDGITPGTVHLFAQRRREKQTRGVSVAYARAEIEVAPGGEATWDAVIEDGLAVEGVVLYRDGFPIPGLFITLADAASGTQHVIVSDEKGVFRFLCLEESTYEIRVQLWDAPKGEPPLKAMGVVPDRGRTELRTTYDRPVKQKVGTVVGRIDDLGRRIRNPKAAQVTLHSDDRWFRPGGQIENGAFRFERVTPCRFRLTLMEGDTALAHSGWFELQAAATVDTGTLVTESAGAIRILAPRDAGTEGLQPKLYLKRKDDPGSTTIDLGRAAEHLADNLTPGDYGLSGYAEGMVSLRATAAVTAGTVSALRLELRRGAQCEFEIWWPEGPAKSIERSYRILDAGGKVLHEYAGGLHNSSTRPYKLASIVPPGRWKLEFSTDDGLSVVTDFEVPATFEAVKRRLDLK